MSLPILLSTAYLPPLHYIKQMLHNETIVLEQNEYFIKQTYRNRCNVMTANGAITLSIPLVNRTNKELITEKKISYVENWQQQHWRTFMSSYKNSPYFDFFEHEFRPFYETQYEYLFEFNLELLNTILKIIRQPKQITFTESYVKEPLNTINLRSLSDLHSNIEVEHKPYYQVFSSKFNFTENLSCIDALFNIGLDIKTL